MLQLFCTQKLIAKLPVTEGTLPESEKWQASANKKVLNNPLSGWHANLLMLQRRNCVLLVHNQTRFPVFIIGLTKPDFAALDYRFTDCFMNTLLNVGASEKQMQAAHHLLAPVSINKANDRSVQGTMNQMKGDIEQMLWHDNAQIMDCSPYKTAAWLADRPCNIKGQKDCIWPIDAMFNLLTR